MQEHEFQRDTALLKARVDLDRAMADSRSALSAAQARRDIARERDADCRRALGALDEELHELDAPARVRGDAVYLHGTRLDRGTLTLARGALRFAGWYGQVAIPLGSIAAMELGQSQLPPLAGVPVLARLPIGAARPREALLLTVQAHASDPARRAVLADLPDAARWRDEILGRQLLLQQSAAEHASLAERREQAAAAAREAGAELASAQAEVGVLEQDLAELQRREQALVNRQREVEAARRRAQQVRGKAYRGPDQR